MNKNIIAGLFIFLLSIIAGNFAGIFLLQKRIDSLESQLSRKSPIIERYGTIKSIDFEKKTFLLTYKNLFNTEEENLVYAKWDNYTITEEKNPIFVDGVIVKLSKTRRIDPSNLQMGDRIFVRFSSETSDDKFNAVFIKRGLPFFP